MNYIFIILLFPLAAQAQSVTNQNLFDTVLPVNPTLPRFPQHYDKQEHILALNKLLASHAKDADYTYVDIFHLFVDAEGRLDSQYTYEGLHLKPPAYTIWVDYLKKQGFL
jgi:lysophospholipase L1-like esterase